MPAPWMIVSDVVQHKDHTMNTPTEYGKPVSKTTRTERKTVKMVLTTGQHMEALSEYLTKNFPQFRNMNIAFDYMVLNYEHGNLDWEDLLVEATAFRERTK